MCDLLVEHWKSDNVAIFEVWAYCLLNLLGDLVEDKTRMSYLQSQSEIEIFNILMIIMNATNNKYKNIKIFFRQELIISNSH